MSDPDFEAFFEEGIGTMLFGPESKRIIPLLKQGRYENAKAILRSSNEPHAKLWIEQIDELEAYANGLPITNLSDYFKKREVTDRPWLFVLMVLVVFGFGYLMTMIIPGDKAITFSLGLAFATVVAAVGLFILFRKGSL